MDIMPIYMDRHNVSEIVTAENVAELHQHDLKIQHKFGCRGLTYWFDEKRNTAFCLIEAPDKESIQLMHDHAHGEIPHKIIEVDTNVVESFLGRIQDPEKTSNTKLNIIKDPAFRTIMVITLKNNTVKYSNTFKEKNLSTRLRNIMSESILECEGRIVKQIEDYFLISFDNISKAIKCALDVKSKFAIFIKEFDEQKKIKIALNAGMPVAEKDSIFEETISLADRICYFAKGEIVVSSIVYKLLKNEKLLNPLVLNQINKLSLPDEKFLNLLIDYLEIIWKNSNVKVDDFGKELGFSKTQFYRKMILVTGLSPNTFIKEYRLDQSLKLLNEKSKNISEVAFETGFNGLSYFSKCFQKKYGCSPTEYQNSLEV